MAEITTSGSDADLSFEVRWRKALEQPEVSIVDAKKIEIDVSPSAILAPSARDRRRFACQGRAEQAGARQHPGLRRPARGRLQGDGAGQAAGSAGCLEAAAARGAAEVSALADRILDPGPKRLLAIDGGGIRGVLALEILAAIERQLGQGRRTSASATISTTSPAPAPAASSPPASPAACRSPRS